MAQTLTEDEVRERLNSDKNLVSRFRSPSVTITPIQRPGRTLESPNFPPEEKVEIASRTRLGETLTSIAIEKDTTPSVIRNIKNGKTKVDEAAVAEKVATVQDVALLKLMNSLGYITDEKLQKLSAKDLGNFAASISKVVSNTTQKDHNDEHVHLHLYAPELRAESSFKTIEVRGS